MVEQSVGNTQRLLKMPSSFKSKEVNRLLPFIVAIRQNNMDMFRYFWDQLGYVYCKEDNFHSLLRILAKRDRG
jgi:ankyrin repeat protein